MNNYETLQQICADHKVPVWEANMKAHDGLYMDGCIQINSTLGTSAEKACILAEEYGHHLTAVGDITGTDPWSEKQELQGRRYAYFTLCPIEKIADLILNKKLLSWNELAEELNVTEQFLKDAVHEYVNIYGPYVILENGSLFYLDPLGAFYKVAD